MKETTKAIKELRKFIKDNELPTRVKINHYRRLELVIEGKIFEYFKGLYQKPHYRQLTSTKTLTFADDDEQSWNVVSEVRVSPNGGKTTVEIEDLKTGESILVESICSTEDRFCKSTGIANCLDKI